MKLPHGKGMYIWKRRLTDKGELAAMVARAQAWGLDWVAIKIADGQNRTSETASCYAPANVEPMVAAFKDIGISVWGWQYSYLIDARAEARLAVALLAWYGAQLDGFIIDAEGEAKGRYAGASDYMSELRGGYGGPVGLSSFRFPRYHPNFPWQQFKSVDFWQPQVYWEGAHNPAHQLAKSAEQLRAIAKLPIVPAGSVYKAGGWAPTVDDLKEFHQAVVAGGYPAELWWCWNTAAEVPNWNKTLASYTWPHPQSAPEPSPSPETETSPAEQRYRVRSDATPHLNVRTGPGLGYADVGDLLPGDEVVVGQQVHADGYIWGQIGPARWVAMRYLEPISGAYQRYRIKAGATPHVNVRSGPGVKYADLGDLAPGAEVLVYETVRTSKYTWGRIDPIQPRWIALEYCEAL